MNAHKVSLILILIGIFQLVKAQDLNVYLLYQLAVCPGTCDADVHAVVEGGLAPYYYTWSNGATTTEIYDQCVGTGYITVTDASGNSATAEYSIESYPVPLVIIVDSMYFTITQPSGGLNNGSIAVDSSLVLDPAGLYLDSVWSIDGINFTIYHIFSNLGPGVYHLYVRTIQGCTVPVSGEFILYDITSLENLTATFNLFPNPATDLLQLTSDVPLAAELIDMHGKSLMVSGAKRYHQLSMIKFPEGIYMVKISDGKEVAFRKIIKN